ncbi:alcohol dehydrogenase [Corynebacterium hylobatis]|uniref:Alcohol dehydrogenase n=1 Tax=Corynebacterium hylobatis TaxID=1859290 RepID=A0A3S0B2X3_9CORY|nr:zinc-dependent alcohol dehydrogenase family protein [Corynebacterium hylobatis]RSZ61398.1 alcohol dehydrogenase [Corynebacterium hylobatis]
MKALVLTEFGKDLEIMTMPDPTPEADGVVIRIEANGVCRSDWHLWMGDWDWLGLKVEFPHVLGHEFSGVVEEVGSGVSRFAVGDRVFVPHAHGCGVCEYCLSGFTNVCANVIFAGTDYWGGYGQYVAVPAADRNLVRLPDGVSFEAAAGLGCRFMTAWHGVVDQAKVQPGEWVAVHGSGGMGLSAIQIASAVGASVIAVDINDKALEMARNAGAVHTINSLDTDPVEAVRELTAGGVHVGIDALGIQQTCLNSLNSLRKRGRHLQAGLTSQDEKGAIPVPIDAIALQELSIIGCANMPIARFPDMMRMVESGTVDPAATITRRVGLEGAREVLQGMGTYSVPGITILNDWQ